MLYAFRKHGRVFTKWTTTLNLSPCESALPDRTVFEQIQASFLDAVAVCYQCPFIFDKLDSGFRENLGFTGIKINEFYHVSSQF